MEIERSLFCLNCDIMCVSHIKSSKSKKFDCLCVLREAGGKTEAANTHGTRTLKRFLISVP